MNKFLILIVSFFITATVNAAESSAHFNSAYIDLIGWKLNECGTENWAQEISPAGTSRSINTLKVPFKWDYGLRLGLSRDINYDNWDISGSYTWYDTTASTQASVTSGGIYSGYLGNFFANNTDGKNYGPNYRNASMQWKFLYNVVDLELGRKFKPSPILLLHPFIGVKIASIKQTINTTWQNPNPDTFFFITIPQNFTFATETFKNDFWGVGPEIGLDTSWSLYKNANNLVNLIGNFSAAVMWGHWKFNDQYKNNNNVNISVNIDNVNGGASMVSALLGLEWKRQFNTVDFNLRFGYEAQVWFNQLQYYTFNTGRMNTLLSLQGCVLGIALNY